MSESRVRGTTYVWTWLGLLVLTTLTLLLSGLSLGPFEMPVALAIATIKAILVALFFMHLVEERFANRLIPLVAAAFVVLLVVLSGLDVATR